MTDYVLDSFALLALVQGEPGAARVQGLLSQAQSGAARLFMTTVNLCETLYVTYRRRGPDGLVTVLNLTADLPIEVVAADLTLAVTAARMKAVLPISLADCFAAALALHQQAPVLTGDPDFQRLAGQLRVEWLPTAG